MKNLIAMAMLCAGLLFSINVQAQTKMKTDTTKKAKSATVIYTCPMHHDVVAYKPGKCPKPNCGMTLVKKSDLDKKGADSKMKM
ncbi:MAG TPA: heavy metal-binding domain-containing protein [Mucilaginibacter sp.]|jgi:hypothetical protein